MKAEKTMSWQIDPSHSQITFSIRHMMVTNVRGNFDKFSGEVKFDEKNLAQGEVDVTIDVASVNTRDEKRDGHLKSPDFFDVATYPTMIFKSKKINLVADKKGTIIGDLTIKGVTHEVKLEAELVGVAKNPFGATMAGFNASTKINRKDWNLGWNVALEAGGVLVGEDVTIHIELELTHVPEAVATA